MRSRYKITEAGQIYFITCTIVAWIPIFTRKAYLDIILNSLNFCRQNKGLKVFAFAILDNHLHLVVSADNLSNTIKDFKRHTAREIIRLAQCEKKNWLLNQFKFYRKTHKGDSVYQVWQEGFHPKQLISEDIVKQKIEYIHHNPVRAGLVEKAEEWLYSSARNYLGGDGLMEIDGLEL